MMMTNLPRWHSPFTGFGLVLGIALALSQAPARADDAPLGAELDGLIAHARLHNPELAAARLEADALRERIGPARALPDPRFELELMDATNTMDPGRSASLLPGEVGATRYRVVQMLPFAGKRRLRGEVAEALAERSDSMASATQLKIEAAIKTAFARHYLASGQIRILGETIALVEGLEQLVLTRYGLGLVPQQDAVQVQGELTSLKIDLLEAERRRLDAAAKLNALLPRPPDAPLAEPAGLPALPPTPRLAGLIERASTQSPEVERERAALSAAEHSRALAYRERYPDFGVALSHNRPRGGRESWDLMLELNIPLQQASRRSREREAERRVEAAAAQRESVATRLAGRIGELTAAIQARRDQASLLRDTLLPQAEANLDAAQAGYESGKVNFNTLIEAERRILRARLALLDAEVETRVGLAELEQITGVAL
jgi:outer membrane protein, heavy metal efflux system